MSGSTDLEKEARKRLRLVTPENAAKVLAKDIYWTVPFLQLYLDRCDYIGADEPKRALLMATHAPSLARRIDIGLRPGEYTSVENKNSHIVRAFSVLGSLNRRCGNFHEARGCHAYAFELVEGDAVSDYARGDLLQRYGRLQSATDSEGALDTFAEAVSIFMKIQHCNGLAATLIARASLYCRQNRWILSAADLRHACAVADENTEVGRRMLHAAQINLFFVVANGGIPLTEQAKVLKSISGLRSKLSQKRFSRTKANLFWMEGLLHKNLGFTRHAERVLERARRSFIRLEDPYDFVTVTLDLAQVMVLDWRNK